MRWNDTSDHPWSYSNALDSPVKGGCVMSVRDGQCRRPELRSEICQSTLHRCAGNRHISVFNHYAGSVRSIIDVHHADKAMG